MDRESSRAAFSPIDSVRPSYNNQLKYSSSFYSDIPSTFSRFTRPNTPPEDEPDIFEPLSPYRNFSFSPMVQTMSTPSPTPSPTAEKHSPVPNPHPRPPAPTVEEEPSDPESPDTTSALPQIRPSASTNQRKSSSRRPPSMHHQSSHKSSNSNSRRPRRSSAESAVSTTSRASSTFSRASKLDEPPKFIKFESAANLTLPSQLEDPGMFRMGPLFVGKKSFGLFDKK